MNSPILLDDKSVLAIYLLIDGGIALALGLAYVLVGGDREALSSGPDRCHHGKVPALSQRACESGGADQGPCRAKGAVGGAALQRGGAGRGGFSQPGEARKG